MGEDQVLPKHHMASERMSYNCFGLEFFMFEHQGFRIKQPPLFHALISSIDCSFAGMPTSCTLAHAPWNDP